MLIRGLWQLKSTVFRHWRLLQAVLLLYNATATGNFHPFSLIPITRGGNNTYCTIACVNTTLSQYKKIMALTVKEQFLNSSLLFGRHNTQPKDIQCNESISIMLFSINTFGIMAINIITLNKMTAL